MTYYPDLSEYRYSESSTPALNIGWLDGHHPFTTGDTPPALLGVLISLARNPTNVYRGIHFCELCPTFSEAQKSLRHDGAFLGTGEIRVVGRQGIEYAAPCMIIHYISDHNYLPPEEFIEATLSSAAS
ncbi:hypothetical protein [Streptomyces sp. JJ38]|uniref:DUF7919 family protein n=1 Tax=Streptomyces sp. JJ38 TaxID=2738128 RepID=UPI001C56189A|nr:hypothetical protein [Streptomyces sp. JJ38]MBW1599621.1 hypothetical protein [Streptomyces sp. JJ38]